MSAARRPVRPIRLLIAALAGATLIAAFVRYRFEARKPGTALPLLARVRDQLALAPIMSAEAALRGHPDDPQPRLHLAAACAQTGDPAGAALALYPLLDRINRERTQLVAQYVGYCAQLGWLEEGLAAIRRLPARGRGVEAREVARARLALAGASVAHGEAARAVSLLAAVERDGADALEMGDWLDGAMTWYQCREPERAVAWARQGVARAPDNPAGRAVLARCLLAAGQPEAALQALPAPVPGVEADPLVDYWRGRAELRCRDAARRQSGLQRLTHLGMHDPLDPIAAFEAGRAWLHAGQADRAVALLSRAAPSGYQGVLTHELLAAAYARRGRAVAAAWARGRAESFRGRLSEAEASLRRSLDPGPPPPGAARELARVLTLRGKPQAALGVLQRARRSHPTDLDLALGEADALNALDRFDDQARTLEAAASLIPERAFEPLRNLGKMYYETRQFDRVIPVLERAVQLAPGDAASHRYLGLCYALRPEDPTQAERAVDHLLRAATIEPDDSTAWTSAGAVLARMDYLAEASTCYRRSIDGNNSSEGAYFSLAQALQRQGRRAESALLLRLFRVKRDLQARRSQLERRITGDRGDPISHYEMGDLLLRTEGHKAAFPYLLIAASLQPRWRKAQARLADACALLDYVDLWQEAERRARNEVREEMR